MFFDTQLYYFFLILFLELLLGFDNIVVISTLVSQYKKKRLIFGVGLFLALFLRVVVLFFLAFLSALHQVVFWNLSWEDVIFLFGGVFLIYRGFVSVLEFFHSMRLSKSDGFAKCVSLEKDLTKSSFFSLLFQICLIDFVFSLDSILTAIAITKNILTIVIAFFVNIVILLILCQLIIKFLTKYRMLNLLAFVFIIILGFKMLLISLHINFNQYYLYFVTVLSMFVSAFFYKIKSK